MITRRTLIAIGALAASLVVAAPALATFPGTNGRIAYTGSDYQIHTILPSGSGDATLAAGLSTSWSPNGQRIVFPRGVKEQAEIYSMRGDGSDVRRLTHSPLYDSHPSYSPSGRRIVFTTNNVLDGDVWVRRMRSDGSNVRTLAKGGGAVWSPTENWIAYGNLKGGIWAMRPNGTDRHPLTTGADRFSDYSPDGGHITFVRVLKDEDEVTMIMRSDGSRLHPLPCLSRPTLYATAVSYSPDGRWLLGQVPVYISDPRVIDYFNLIRFPVGPCLNGTLRAHQVIGRTEGAASWQALP